MSKFLLFLAIVYSVFVPGLIVATGTVFPVVLLLLVFVFLAVVLKYLQPFPSSAVRHNALQASSAPLIIYRNSALWWLPIGVVLVALVRGATNGDIKELAVASQIGALQLVAYIIIFGIAFRKSTDYSILLYWVMVGIAVLCITNLVLWMLGISALAASVNPTAENSASFLASLGLELKRAIFPISSGTTDYGRICALLVCYGLAIIGAGKTGIRKALLIFMFVIVPLVQLLLTDSRGAMLYMLAASSLYFGGTRSLKWRAISITVFLLLLPIILTVATSSGLVDGNAFGARTDSKTGVFTGREIVWTQALEKLSQFETVQLFGYGAYGQSASGVSALYQDAFGGFREDSDLISLHNGVLQGIFDYGYFGMLGICFVFWKALSRYCAQLSLLESKKIVKRRSRLSRAPLVIFCYLIASGATEAVPSPYSPECLLVLMAALGVLLCYPKKYPSSNSLIRSTMLNGRK